MFINLTVILFCKKSCILCTFIYIIYLQALPRIIMHIIDCHNWMQWTEKNYISVYFLGELTSCIIIKKGKKIISKTSNIRIEIIE